MDQTRRRRSYHSLFNVLNDIKREYILKGAEGIDIGMLGLNIFYSFSIISTRHK